MTNLDSILESRDIVNKGLSIQSYGFPVVMYGCESWTIKKAECQIDAFELWCWRRLLKVPWIAGRSNQAILKEISPEYSLEGLMLKLTLQYFGHLIRNVDSLEKTLMLGKIGGRRRGRQRMRWLDGITNPMDMGLHGSWRHFLYSSSVYSFHLFLISFAPVSFILFLSFIISIFAWDISLISLSFFPILLFSSISFQWSLRKAFSVLAVMWNSAFRWVDIFFSPLPLTSFLFSAICKASSDNQFAFLHCFFLEDGHDRHLLYNVMNLCP